VGTPDADYRTGTIRMTLIHAADHIRRTLPVGDPSTGTWSRQAHRVLRQTGQARGRSRGCSPAPTAQSARRRQPSRRCSPASRPIVRGACLPGICARDPRLTLRQGPFGHADDRAGAEAGAREIGATPRLAHGCDRPGTAIPEVGRKRGSGCSTRPTTPCRRPAPRYSPTTSSNWFSAGRRSWPTNVGDRTGDRADASGHGASEVILVLARASRRGATLGRDRGNVRASSSDSSGQLVGERRDRRPDLDVAAHEEVATVV
jgi:hypothetical protein